MSNIDIKSLQGGYKGYEAVFNNFSISIPEHKLSAIAGPNGSGKTTLLRFLINQLHPIKGNILIKEEEVRSISYKRLGTIVSLSNQESQSISFSVRDVVSMGRYPWDDNNKQAIQQALEDLDLNHLSTKPFNTLSSGEKQRTMIARALCQDTEILLMDEPVTNLDPFYQERVMQLIRTLSSRKTIICILHDINSILKYCDHCILMKEGRVLDSGESSKVLSETNLKSAYGINAIFMTNPFTGRPILL